MDLGTDTSSVHYISDENGEGKILADYVIDASGQKALVSNQEKVRKWDKDFKFQAVWAYYDKSDYLDSQGTITPFEKRYEINPMSLGSSTGNWGWVWHLLMKDKVSVGAVIPNSDMEEFRSRGSSLKERYQSHINDTPVSYTHLTLPTIYSV